MMSAPKRTHICQVAKRNNNINLRSIVMKKTVVSLIALITIASFFSGCGQSAAQIATSVQRQL